MLRRHYTIISKMILGLFVAAGFIALMPLQSAMAAPLGADKNAAVIYVYQRIGEDSLPESNVSLDQFKEHISVLKSGGYHVLPLSEIVAALKPGGKPLPSKTVGITFEGAFLPTINNVRPLLDAEKFPFTVFYTSDMVDSDSPNYMTWNQLKSLKKDDLATLGILPSSYTHMTEQDEAANAALVNNAVAKYRDVFKEEPAFFAWPYGEHSTKLKKLLARYHFKAVFGQQSGVAYTQSDFMALPRFTMTNEYGDIDRFRLTASALPLPVSDVVPDDMLITQNVAANQTIIGFTISPEIKDISKLSCFVSDIGKVKLSQPGNNRIEIRLSEPLQDRRTRVNCTLPGTQGWRWLGMLFVSPSMASDEDISATPSDAPQDSNDSED